MDGHEAHRIRIAWEERLNKSFPGAVLLMENVQYLLLAPHDPDRIVTVMASTRYRQGQDPLNVDALAASFARSIRFD